jgi:hypothetical protein
VPDVHRIDDPLGPHAPRVTDESAVVEDGKKQARKQRTMQKQRKGLTTYASPLACSAGHLFFSAAAGARLEGRRRTRSSRAGQGAAPEGSEAGEGGRRGREGSESRRRRRDS